MPVPQKMINEHIKIINYIFFVSLELKICSSNRTEEFKTTAQEKKTPIACKLLQMIENSYLFAVKTLQFKFTTT